MFKLIFTTLLSLSVVSGFSSGNKNTNSNTAQCGTITPGVAWENSFQQQLNQLLHNNTGSQNRMEMVDDSVIIPVIVHVCFYSPSNPGPGTTYNISQGQVNSQIAALNLHFAGNSPYTGSIPGVFAPLKANTKIKWCLATMDQNGNILAEPGIDRINTRVIGLPTPIGAGGATVAQWRRTYIEDTLKPATIWNPKFYCNIWVIPGFIPTPQGTVLAYASFPTLTTLDGIGAGTGFDYNDGIVCGRQWFGTEGAALPPYNHGGTTSHELGHWLGLRHIWGDDSCGTDYVADTPTQEDANGGSPTFPHVTCNNGPNGDMFMNYMDYTNDDVYSMFTLNQKDRMWTAMNTGQYRVPLKTSPTCSGVVPAPVADFTDSSKTQVLCTSKTIRFKDKSLFAVTAPASAVYTWSFPGGTPSSGTGKFVDVTYTTGGLKSVSLTITNSRGTNTITKDVSVSISSSGAFPLLEDFEGVFFPPVGWETVVRNGNQNINWEGVNGSSAYGIGNRAMKFDNTTLDAGFKRDDIMTYKMNLTGVTDAKLKFDLAHAPYYNATGVGIGIQQPNPKWIWDTLEVLITDNCQGTTQSIYRKGDSALATVMPGQGDEFYPLANQWRTDSVVIPAGYLNKPNVQIIFRNYGGFGHSIYVDNINVKSNVVAPVTASFNASDTVVCAGGSLTFTNTSTATSGSPDSVRWTLGGGVPGTSTSTTTVSPVFSTVGNFTISLIAYKGGVASAVASKGIRVKIKPTVTVNTPAAICVGQSASLSASGATTYTWTGGLASTQNPTAGPLTTTTTYTVTGTTSGCTGTAVTTVAVNPSPSVTVNTPAAICAGGSASLSASGASSYTWTGGLAAIQNPTAGPLTTTTTYTVTGTSSGCTGTAVTTVTVTPLPNVTVNSPAICSGQSANLSASGASSYTWTGGLTAIQNPNTGPLTTTTTYTVTGTSSGCTKTAVATVTVTAPPTVTVNSPTICSGQSATLSASGASSYTWTGGLASTQNPSTGPLTTTTTYTVTGTTGCSGTAVAIVTVNPSPTVTVNSATICAGTSASLSASGASSYTWTGGLAAIQNPSAGPLTTTTTYTVTGTASGCTGTAVSTVTVTPLPNVTVNSPAICSGQSANLSASGATSYTWTGGLTAIQNPNTGPLTTTTTYTVTGTSSGCTKTAVATVSVSSTLNVTVNSPTICSGSSASLSASGATGYTWTGGLAATQNPSTGALTTTTTYTVTGSSGSCSNTAVATVTVNPSPTVTVNSASICSGSSASLSASGASSYTWTGGLASIQNPSAGPLTTTTTYTVTGTASGCTGTATSTVTVKPVPATPSITQSNDTLHSSTVVSGASYEWYLGASLQATTLTPYLKLTVGGSYTVKVIKDGCTSIASAPFSATLVGIRNSTNSIKVFEVYPNPTEGRLVMNLSLTKSASVQIRIYTPEGRELYAKGYTNTRNVFEEVSMSDYAKGVYIIKLNVDDETYYHKVAKQ